MLTLKKHREEHSSSRGFTIAELGAGMGVFALAAAMMAPVAMNAATSSLTGETVITVADTDGRKPITTPPVDAVEVTVVDANGNDVKTVTVNDPSATSTVISGLDSNATYTFEVAKVNMAGKSAKAAAIVEYKQTGTRSENYTVTEQFTDTASETVGSSAEQVDDLSAPIYVSVKDQPIWRNVDEEYSVQEERWRTKTRQVAYQVKKTRYENRTRVETVRTNHQHEDRRDQAYTYNHPHTESRSYNHVHSSNHVHRSSYNHRHANRSSYCHYHSRYYRCHSHTRTTYSNHTHYTSSNHTHYSNHTHTESYTVNHSHTGYRSVLFGYYNHVHESKNTINWQEPVTYYETAYKTEPYQEKYFVTVTKTRVVPKQFGWTYKNEFRGYQKKTQYRLCYQPRGFGGARGAQQCEVHSSPASKTISWQFTNSRNVQKTRYLPVYNHVKKAPEVRAPRNFVVFKASSLAKGKVAASGEVAAVGSGVSGISKGATKSFLKWSGRTFTFNGEQYVQVHKWALRN